MGLKLVSSGVDYTIRFLGGCTTISVGRYATTFQLGRLQVSSGCAMHMFSSLGLHMET